MSTGAHAFFERAALYGMPTIAVFATAMLALGPGRERPITAARVWAVPAEGATRAAWRVELVRRGGGADDAGAATSLRVEARADGAEAVVWTGATTDDGLAEVRLEGQVAWKTAVQVRITDGPVVLAEGRVPLVSVPAPTFEPAMIAGFGAEAPQATGAPNVEKRGGEGTLKIKAEIPRGTLAAPFPERVTFFLLLPEGQSAPSADLMVVDVQGAKLSREFIITEAPGAFSLVVTPSAHDVTIDFGVSRPPELVHELAGKGGDIALPVHPGALWLDPIAWEKGKLVAVAPGARKRIFVSAYGAVGRIWGAIATTHPDATVFEPQGTIFPPILKRMPGFDGAEIEVPADVRSATQVVRLASDLNETGSGTVDWPIAPAEGKPRVAPLSLVLDGLPTATAAEARRARGARLAAVTVAFSAAIFEVLLLVWLSRASQSKLDAHLKDTLDEAAIAEVTIPKARRVGAIVGMGALILLAFGAMAAWALFR